jgi:hypothetical protein
LEEALNIEMRCLTPSSEFDLLRRLCIESLGSIGGVAGRDDGGDVDGVVNVDEFADGDVLLQVDPDRFLLSAIRDGSDIGTSTALLL